MAKAKQKLPVQWFLPDKKDHTKLQKKPFEYSTVATSNTIALFAEDTEHKTPNEILQLIPYDADAIRILQGYIDKGFGDVSLNVKYGL